MRTKLRLNMTLGGNNIRANKRPEYRCSLSNNDNKIDIRRYLYGLYKHIIVGVCRGMGYFFISGHHSFPFEYVIMFILGREWSHYNIKSGHCD